jgi:hypothetical protein
MDDAHDSHERTATYDPADVDLPAKAPPLRQTAPQTPYTGRQVGLGLVVFLIGLAVTFGLPVVMA